MKKNLKKLDKAEIKVRFHLFLEILEFTIHCAIILFIAYLFDRLIQMALFILFLKGIQNCFKMQFHADTLFPDDAIKATNVCKVITIVMEVLYLFYCKDLSATVYSNLFIIIFIAFVNALLEFALRNVIVKKLNKRDIILSIVENDEEKIDAFCLSKGLINTSETVYLYLNNTVEETSAILGIDTKTVQRRIDSFIKKSRV